MSNLNLLKHPNLDNEKILMARLMTGLSVLLFISGIGLDYISTVAAFDEIFRIRLVVCTTLALLFMITFKQEFFLANYSILIGAVYLIAAFAVIMMIYHTEITEIGYTTYFAGLMLIIITVFLGTYIDTIMSIAISSVMIISFVFMSLVLKDNPNINIVLNNIFFLGSSVIIGIISNSMRNKFLADKLFLQERLKESLREEKAVVNEKTELANMDALTNLPNRRHSRERLAVMVDDAERLNMAMVIIYLDLNKFKLINDTYGHKVGDEVLVIVANRLDGLMRKNDLVSRQGGDEFLLSFLVDKKNMDYVDNIEKNIIEVLSKTMTCQGLRLAIGASVGYSIYPTNGLSVNALIEIADHNMYESKKHARDSEIESVREYDPSNSRGGLRLIKKSHLSVID